MEDTLKDLSKRHYELELKVLINFFDYINSSFKSNFVEKPSRMRMPCEQEERMVLNLLTGKKQCFNIKDMKVPFNDLQRHHLDIKEIDAAIDRVINCSSFIRGEDVDRFEEEFSNLFNVKHTVSCANGTDAITIAAKALDIKKGDEVIVPANSWISSSAAITQAGGTPIFCDVNEYTYCIDVEKIEDKITCNTVGILPVHLFGHPAEMPTIMKIAEKHKLWVIEDCAQGHLGSIDGKLVGLLETLQPSLFILEKI